MKLSLVKKAATAIATARLSPEEALQLIECLRAAHCAGASPAAIADMLAATSTPTAGKRKPA